MQNTLENLLIKLPELKDAMSVSESYASTMAEWRIKGIRGWGDIYYVFQEVWGIVFLQYLSNYLIDRCATLQQYVSNPPVIFGNKFNFQIPLFQALYSWIWRVSQQTD